jgi:5-methylthioadenosine/S-adenosylhomocysteine deaminase
MRNKYRGYKRLDFGGHLILPGFINAHTHAAITLCQGLGEDMPLFEMLQKVLFPLEKKIKDSDAYLGALVGGLEFIRSGTTSVNNINASWSQSVVKAFDELGLRGTLAITLKDHDLKTHEKYDCSKLVDENIRLVKSLANHPQLKGMFGIANEVEASEELLKRVQQLAREFNTGVHMHVAETLGERGYILQRTGKTSVRYLYDLGLLTERSLAVHAVNVSKSDILTLAKSRATVVHCPTVNMSLGSGVSPVPEMLEKGVSVGIGVDDPVSNMSDDIRVELNNARMLAKASGHTLSLKQLLSLAWNSRLYGYSVGHIKEGCFADIITVDLRNRLVPKRDDCLLRETIFAGSPVDNVIIGGKFVMHNGEIMVLDEAKVLKRAQKAANHLLK